MRPEKITQSPAETLDIAAVLQGARPRRRVPRWLIWAIVAVVAAGGAWYFLAGSNSSTTLTYVTEPAAKGDLTVLVTATGTVEPTNKVELSSELSGTVASVEANFNDVVKKGQVLAMLDTDQLKANVELAGATLSVRQAEVDQAETTLTEKQSLLGRAARLAEKAVSSTETHETAKANSDRATSALAAARANLRIARANLEIAQSNLDKACICSPIDGVVLDRNVEVGQIVASSFSAPVLFTLAEDLAEMQLEVDVDEADIGAVRNGEAATFTVEAFHDRTFPAAIAQIRLSPETVEGVVTYKAILSVENTGQLLRPGMTATAEITVESVKDALLVPNAALRYAPPSTAQSSGGSGLLGLFIPARPNDAQTGAVDAEGRYKIYILKDGAPVAVTVDIGASDGTHTEITSGDLGVGDAVIVGAKSAT